MTYDVIIVGGGHNGLIVEVACTPGASRRDILAPIGR